MPDWLAVWVFLVGILLGMFSNFSLYGYLVNMYIVDVCIPEDRYVLNSPSLMSLIPPSRTTALSKIAGWGALGTDLIGNFCASSQIVMVTFRHLYIICSGRIHYNENR